MPNQSEQIKKLSWERVDKYLQEKTSSGAALALVETEKIFSEVIKKLGYPGKTTNERVQSAKPFIKNFKDLELARSVYRKIIDEVNVEISPEDIQSVLNAYYQVIRDLTQEAKKNKSPWQKLRLRFRYVVPQPKRLAKKLAIWFFGCFFVVFLLDTTSFGRGLVNVLVAISHFIFSWILWTVLIVIGLTIVVLGALFFFSKRKRSRQKIRVEE